MRRWTVGLLRVAGMAALCALTAEGLLAGYHWLKTGELIWTRAAAPLATSAPEAAPATGAMSPFFGYTMRQGQFWTPTPEWLRENFGDGPTPEWVSWRANNYGFVSDRDYPAAVADNDYVVGVFGSSVAQGLTSHGRAALIAALAKSPAAAGRNVVVLNFTQGGYKQPQQLAVLSYFVALGQRFDLVINMDGMTGGYIGWDNVASYGVDPLMPTARFLYRLQNRLSDAGFTRAAAATRARLDWIDSTMPRVRAATAHYLLKAVRRLLEQREDRLISEEGRVEPGRDYVVQLEAAGSREFAAHVERIAQVWARSSLAMAALARQIGAAYLHVLEPNQYLGRKPLSDAERQIMAAADEPLAEIVPLMYAALHTASERLAGQVRLVDATGVFEGHGETLYIDHCCHFNPHGYQLLIDKTLAPELQALPPRSSAAALR